MEEEFNRSTGMRCPVCWSKVGEPHTTECQGELPVFASFSIDSAGAWAFGLLPLEELDDVDLSVDATGMRG